MPEQYVKEVTGQVEQEINSDYDNDALILLTAQSLVTTASGNFELLNVTIKFASPTSVNFKIEIDSVAGTAYDTEIWSKTLSSQQDVIYISEGLILVSGDQVRVTIGQDIGNIAYVVIRRRNISEVD